MNDPRTTSTIQADVPQGSSDEVHEHEVIRKDKFGTVQLRYRIETETESIESHS